jgi:AraC-like DNA-binding protein
MSICSSATRIPEDGAFGSGIAAYFDFVHANEIKGWTQRKISLAGTGSSSNTGASRPPATLPDEMAFTAVPQLRALSAQKSWLRVRDPAAPKPTAGRARTSLGRGGLACWQVRRSQEVMLGNIDSNVSLGRVAKECRLSKGHFGRAFKQTLGRPPHRWLLEQRVEKAKGLLVSPKIPISEIALDAGFADHAHFTRVCSKVTGTTPGAWRRAVSA